MSEDAGMQNTHSTTSASAATTAGEGFGDIFNQGVAFAERIIGGARQQFNGGCFGAVKCPFIPGSAMHREWMNGVRFAEKKHNFDTGI